MRDGGGVASDADWYYPRAPDSIKQLRRMWLQRIDEYDLVPRLARALNLSSGERKAMLSEQEITVLRGDLITFLSKHGICRTGKIVPGQPLALELWDGLFCLTQDLDTDLPSLLDQGVPTGIVHTIPPSGVWREVEVAQRPDLELLVCDSPWGSGLDDPATLLDLAQADVDAGFAEWLLGGLPEAKARFWARCAAERLGLVHKEGSPPRLIGDSTICNANLLSRVSEKIELPTLVRMLRSSFRVTLPT